MEPSVDTPLSPNSVRELYACFKVQHRPTPTLNKSDLNETFRPFLLIPKGESVGHWVAARYDRDGKLCLRDSLCSEDKEQQQLYMDCGIIDFSYDLSTKLQGGKSSICGAHSVLLCQDDPIALYADLLRKYAPDAFKSKKEYSNFDLFVYGSDLCNGDLRQTFHDMSLSRAIDNYKLSQLLRKKTKK